MSLLCPVPQAFSTPSRFPLKLWLVPSPARGHSAGERSRVDPAPAPSGLSPARPAVRRRRHSWSAAVLGDRFLSAAVIMGNFLSATQKLKPKHHREGSNHSCCTRRSGTALGAGAWGLEWREDENLGRSVPQPLGVRGSEIRGIGDRSLCVARFRSSAALLPSPSRWVTSRPAGGGGGSPRVALAGPQPRGQASSVAPAARPAREDF